MYGFIAYSQRHNFSIRFCVWSNFSYNRTQSGKPVLFPDSFSFIDQIRTVSVFHTLIWVCVCAGSSLHLCVMREIVCDLCSQWNTTDSLILQVKEGFGWALVTHLLCLPGLAWTSVGTLGGSSWLSLINSDFQPYSCHKILMVIEAIKLVAHCACAHIIPLRVDTRTHSGG